MLRTYYDRYNTTFKINELLQRSNMSEKHLNKEEIGMRAAGHTSEKNIDRREEKQLRTEGWTTTKSLHHWPENILCFKVKINEGASGQWFQNGPFGVLCISFVKEYSRKRGYLSPRSVPRRDETYCYSRLGIFLQMTFWWKMQFPQSKFSAKKMWFFPFLFAVR